MHTMAGTLLQQLRRPCLPAGQGAAAGHCTANASPMHRPAAIPAGSCPSWQLPGRTQPGLDDLLQLVLAVGLEHHPPPRQPAAQARGTHMAQTMGVGEAQHRTTTRRGMVLGGSLTRPAAGAVLQEHSLLPNTVPPSLPTQPAQAQLGQREARKKEGLHPVPVGGPAGLCRCLRHATPDVIRPTCQCGRAGAQAGPLCLQCR